MKFFSKITIVLGLFLLCGAFSINAAVVNPSISVDGLGNASANAQKIYFGVDNVIKVKITNNSTTTRKFNLTTGFLGNIVSTAGTNSYDSHMNYYVTYNSTALLTSSGVPYLDIDAGATVEVSIHYIPLSGYKAGSDNMTLTVVDSADNTKQATAIAYWNVPVQTALGIHKIADATSQSISDVKHTVANDIIFYNNNTSITSASTFDVTLQNAASYTGVTGFTVKVFDDVNKDGQYDTGDTLLGTLTSGTGSFSTDAYTSAFASKSMPKRYGVELTYNASDKVKMLNKQVVLNFAFNTEAAVTNDLSRLSQYSALVSNNIIFNGQSDEMSVQLYQKFITGGRLTCGTSVKITNTATSQDVIGVPVGGYNFGCVLYTIVATPLTANAIKYINFSLPFLEPTTNIIPSIYYKVDDIIGSTTTDVTSEFVGINRYTGKFKMYLKSGSTYTLQAGHVLKASFRIYVVNHN